MSSLNIKICAFTHKGKVRDHNEDCIMISNWITSENMKIPKQFEFSLASLDASTMCVVADGIGGNASGEIASQYVCNQLCKHLELIESEEELNELIQDTNKLLYDKMQTDLDNLKGMGTTIAGLYITLGRSFIFNIGDSRVYRLTHNQFEQETIDDTMPRMITLPDGRQVLKRSILTQCLGGAKQLMPVKPHIKTLEIKPQEYYIICSDGLSDMVSDKNIERKIDINDNVNTMRELFTSAMQNGGRDNFSAILIHIT